MLPEVFGGWDWIRESSQSSSSRHIKEFFGFPAY